MEKNYLIGEFSELTGISKRMLRHFDKLELFSPAGLNDENGYRYYQESQTEELKKIQFLRELGFTLSTVKTLMEKPLEVSEFAELLKDNELILTKEADTIKSNLLLLKRTILYLEKQSPHTIPSIDQLLSLEGSHTMTNLEQKKTMALVDLKKLMNRDVFVEKIEEILEKDQNDNYYFLTADIDCFMQVNDIDGFEVGDAVILTVFSIINQEIQDAFEKHSDALLIARLGGDECSVFIKNADHTKVVECIENIYQKIRSFDFTTIGCSQNITISCGITRTGKPAHIAMLKDRSIKALIEAKRNGRNQYVISM